MTATEQMRARVLTGVIDGSCTTAEATALLGWSPRHLRRQRSALLRDGPKVLVHGNRGRRPAHALDPGVVAMVLELASTTYAGCNDQHLSELLAEHHAIALHRSSVRRVLRGAGRPSPQRRRAPNGRAIAIPPGPLRRSYAKARVEIREHMDGSASVYFQGACIARQAPIALPLRTRSRGTVGERPPPPVPSPAPCATTLPWTPGPRHPWRRDSHTTENGRQRYAVARLPSYTAHPTTEETPARTKSRNTQRT